MKGVKELRRDITDCLEQAYIEVLHNGGQPGRGNTKDYAERVFELTVQKALDPATYFRSLVLNTAEASIELRSKKSPLPPDQGLLVFDPSDCDLENAKQAIIRLGDGNFVAWAHATLDDLQVHQDTQIRQGLAIQQRAAVTQSLIRSSIWELSNRSRSVSWFEAMQMNGFWS